MSSDPMSNISTSHHESDDITALIKILGRQFDFIAVTETPMCEAVYVYTIVIRVYGYDKTTTLIAIPFPKQPSKVLFQLHSRNGKPVGPPITLNQLIPSKPSERSTVIIKKGENK
jgi:hypothetical protein